MLPIVDTHQHLWDLSRFKLPWLEWARPLDKDHLMSDYLLATDGLEVVKTVYMEVDVEVGQRAREAEYVIDLCGSPENPMAAAVVGGSPADAGFEAYVRPFADEAFIKGVRQVLMGPEAERGCCLEPDFVRGVQLLGELGLSFDLCLRPSELEDAGALVDRCGDTLFILDHCGNADPLVVSGAKVSDPDDPFAHGRRQWMEDIAALAERPNVVCKISGIIARVVPGQWQTEDLAPTVNHCLDAFGPDRVVFGGDWPVCNWAASYGEWAGALRRIIADRSEADQEKLLHKNAERIYGLGAERQE